MSKTPGTRPDYNWLARVAQKDGTVENDYGSDEFGQAVAGKLKDLGGGELGPGAFLHSSNVAIAYTHLYGFDIEGRGANAALVTRSGEEGSVAEMRIPAAAGLLDKAWNIVVGPELTWSARATTTDYKSEGQAVVARNALEYVWEHEQVGSCGKKCAKEALAFGECAMHVPWDTEAGKDAGVDESNPERPRLLKTGAMDFRRISTWDVLRDPSARSIESLDWIVVREWPNRFDVAASCKTEDQAQAALSSTMADAPAQCWAPWNASKQHASALSDRIPVYYLYCRRTPSVPAGRQARFLGDGTILDDGPLDERYLDLPPNCIGPVVFMYAGEYSGTPWPYTKYDATLGAGQAVDGLYRDLLTNATAVSGPVVSVEDDAMDSAPPTQLGGGPRVIPRPKGSQPPAVLDLNPSSPDHFKLAGTLRGEQREMLGIDSITAGSADISKTLSGAAMALMTSTSVQNNSQWQKSWAEFAASIGTLTIRHIQRMSEPMQIAMAGQARAALVSTTEVQPGDVEGIQRVIVTIGSPMQQTEAGRYEIATTAMKEKWVKTPEQFQEVMDTGRLDALGEDLSNELLVIRAENEALGKGEDVPVMLEDDHRLHIKRHRAVVASLTARRDPEVVAALQAHNDAHLRALRETDPMLLQLMGQEPAPPAAMPGAPPMGPMGPQAQAQAAGPSMPTNPQTGESAGPVAGAKPEALAVKPN